METSSFLHISPHGYVSDAGLVQPASPREQSPYPVLQQPSFIHPPTNAHTRPFTLALPLALPTSRSTSPRAPSPHSMPTSAAAPCAQPVYTLASASTYPSPRSGLPELMLSPPIGYVDPSLGTFVHVVPMHMSAAFGVSSAMQSPRAAPLDSLGHTAPFLLSPPISPRAAADSDYNDCNKDDEDVLSSSVHVPHTCCAHTHSATAAHDDGTTVARLGTYDEAPAFMRGNKYILSGYRINHDASKTLASLFTWHNETLNVWTHLIGFFIFVFIMFHGLQTWLADAPLLDRLMFLVWALAVCFQNFASAFFHWFCCINTRCYTFGCKMDYMAISVTITGAMWPLYHNLFYCYPEWQITYLFVISALTVCAVFVSWYPYFQTPEFHLLRASVFISLGLLPLLGIPHYLQFATIYELWPVIWRVLLEVLILFAGAAIYVTKVPESIFPGRFQTFNSHAIWHCFVVVASLWHYTALYTFQSLNVELGRVPCPVSLLDAAAGAL